MNDVKDTARWGWNFWSAKKTGSANAILHWVWSWLILKKSLTSTRDEERIDEGHQTNRLRAQLGNAHSLPHSRTTWSHTNPTGQDLDLGRVITTSACLHHRWTYISTLGVANGFHSHRLNSNLCTLYCIESYQVLTHASLRSGFHHLNALLTILPSWRWRVFGKWEWSKVIRWGAPTLFHLTIVTPSTLIT